jgi:hypothetical protein
MPNTPRLPGFRLAPEYIRAVKGLLTDEQQRELEWTLANNPVAGDVVARTGGVRKIRVALDAGKRGGARVIYFYRSTVGRIYLLTAYGKNVKDDLTEKEENDLRKLTALLERER